MKASAEEPAPRPHTIALSTAEVIALVKYHTSQARGVTRRYGQAAMEMRAASPLPGIRRLTQLGDLAKAQIDGHADRARELAAAIS